MRIAFVGKGGSGKTTAASLVIRTLLAQDERVLAIDADINQHLGESLGLSRDILRQTPELGNATLALKEILRGSNPRIPSADQMVKTTPPGSGSHLIMADDGDPVLDTFAYQSGRLSFLRTGGFQDQDLGQRCFHAKTGAVELVLNHLIDGPDTWVIVDMTAGADAFASGLFTRFDLTVLLVEPTQKSVSVWEQYKSYARNFGVSLAALGNKVQDKDDIAYLERACGEDLLGSLGQSAWVRQSERGGPLSIGDLEAENRLVLDDLIAFAGGHHRNWETYWRWAKHFHIQNAGSWANAAAGCDVTQQIDDAFLSQFSAGTEALRLHEVMI